MKFRTSLAITLCTILLAGCTTDKSEWVGGLSGGNVEYTVNNLAPNKYMLVAEGAGAVSKPLLEQAFQNHAKQLCLPNKAQTKYTVEPYQYSTGGGGLIYPHDAFKATGVVTCQ